MDYPLNLIFRLPSFRILVLIIGTILIYDYLIHFNFIEEIIIICTITSLLFYFTNKKMLLSFSVSVLLIFSIHYLHRSNSIEYKTIESQNIQSIYGKIENYPVIQIKKSKWYNCKQIPLDKTIKRQKFILKVFKIITSQGKIINWDFYLLVKSKEIMNLKKGDSLIIHKPFIDIKSITNCPDFDYKKYLERKRILFLSYPYSKEQIVKVKEEKLNIIEDSAQQLRIWLIQFYDKYFNESQKELVKGLILGIREGIDEEIIKDFQKAGIIHILALSGLHVGMIAYFFYLIFSIFYLPKKWIIILISLILIFYIMVTGEKISVIRAVIMYCTGALVILLDRSKIYLNALFWAAVFILLIKPNEIYMVGFQLSFLATMGILLFYKNFLNLIFYNKNRIKPTEKKFIRYTKRVLYEILRIPILTISAQLLIVPVLIYHFNAISIISVFSNIPIIILSGLIVALSILLPMLNFSSYLIETFAYSLKFLLNLLIKISQIMANLPIAYFEKLSVKLWMIIIYYCLIFLLLYYIDRRNMFKRNFLA